MDILSDIIDPLLRMMKSTGKAPLSVQQTKISGYYLTNFIYEFSNQLIVNSVFTGFAESKDLSFLKSLCEFIERNAFNEGFKNKIDLCMTTRSDGFAAFPNFPNSAYALSKARSIALNEAIERFVWAEWWDKKTKCIVTVKNPSDYGTSILYLFEAIDKKTKIEKIYEIRPQFNLRLENKEDKSLVILFVKLKDLGFISAGGVENRFDENNLILRCMSELLRHSLAVSRAQLHKANISSLYEKRLLFFASGEGNELVEERMSSSSSEIVNLPNLKFDNIVPHEFQELVTVYRCLFENQRPFIGGALERLCL